MLKSSSLLLAVGLLTSTSAFAGTLTFDGGQTVWHSTQCIKPTAPPSVRSAHPDTSGEDMNAMMGEYNNYVDAVQFYMNCVSNEAATDQTAVNQQIQTSAQKIISESQADLDSSAQTMRERE
jgi:hypothetical protein